MTSNELNEILNKTRRIPDIYLTPKQVEELIKDLENLEKYKKIFDTPLIEIRKQLGILGILKNIIKIDYNTKFTYGNKKYLISLKQDVIVNDETLKIIKEWLENEKNNR